jgi:DNA-binding XRE family transcriptional regulator
MSGFYCMELLSKNSEKPSMIKFGYSSNLLDSRITEVFKRYKKDYAFSIMDKIICDVEIAKIIESRVVKTLSKTYKPIKGKREFFKLSNEIKISYSKNINKITETVFHKMNYDQPLHFLIGQEIRRRRKMLGKTQSEFSVRQATISEMETGATVSNINLYDKIMKEIGLSFAIINTKRE